MQVNDDKSSRLDDDIEYFFGMNLKSFSLIGLRCSFNERVKNFTFLNKLPTFVINLQGIILVVLAVYFIVDIYRDDSSLAMQSSSQLIANIQCMSKGFLVVISIEQIQYIISQVGIIWKAYRPKEESRTKILAAAHKTRFLCKCYLVILIGCNVNFDLPPLINLFLQYRARESTNYTYDFSQRVLLLKYPFEIPGMPTYLLLYFQESYFLFACCVFWFITDTLFAQLSTHICLQLKILKSDFEATINQECVERHLQKSLAGLIKRHRELLRICMLAEDVFSPIIFTTMLLSGLNICINVFEIREAIESGKYEESLVYISIFTDVFLQMLFYCTFAETLTEEASSVADTVYNCKWTMQHYKFRIHLQLIIMRSQRPFYFTAYGFFPIGHKQLTSTINTSFSYYMMLQSMN